MDIIINYTFHLPFTLSTAVLVICIVANVALAWRTWVKNKTHPVNVFYALSVLFTALWTLGLLVFHTSESPRILSLALRSTYFFPILIALCFYLFGHYFPHKLSSLSKLQKYFLFGSTLILLILACIPNVYVPAYIDPMDRFNPNINFVTTILLSDLYLITMLLLTFKNLYIKYKMCDNLWRMRLRQIGGPTLIAFLNGIIFGLILPDFFNIFSLNWIAPICTLFMVGYIWYHVFGKTSRYSVE